MSVTVPQPFWIEATPGALFAWHHRPSSDAHDVAVILCKPFGYEAACTHRAYRHLGQRLAEDGFHVVRPDYHGTGDSSGADSDPDRVSAWVGSIRSAIAWARANLGTRNVVVLGTRLGALLALQVATCEDIDALVLFAPPASGRALLREARALQSLLDGGRKRTPLSEGSEESAGFLLAGPTVEALTKLDPLAAPRMARAALLVARDDLPGAEVGLASKLESRGVEVTLSKAGGYAKMMQYDPHRAIAPDAVWNEISEYLVARYGDSRAVHAPNVSYSPTASVRESDAVVAVREEAVDIQGLFGVLTEPSESSVATRATGIILHNIGANPHIGSNRLYVVMARRWAALGFRVLRFDSAGLGDSPVGGRIVENQVYSQSAIDDSRRAMDFLSRLRGVDHFVLMGLCSGAYVSFHAAVADERVAGIVLMNIMLFHWKEGDPIDVRKRDTVKSTRFYSEAIFKRDAWVRLLRGNVNVSAIAQGLFQKAWARARRRATSALAGESDVARGFRTILHRGSHALLVFAAEDGGRDVVDEHLGTDGARFRNDPSFRLEVIEGTDHTFSPLWSQEVLLSLLTSHLVGRFGAEKTATNAAAAARGAQGAKTSLDRLWD
jgi:pimeloyl-ACP methyl ester carboxylesterase